MKKYYEKPQVHKEIELGTEHTILSGSVVDNISGVTTEGQESGGYYDDMGSGSTFNHNWGD